MAAYYNEIDLKTAAWLRELIKAGLLADGEVDTRSIVDVRPDDLRGFVQCHFFAGIGGWSYALRLARWDDARPVWTGSCPCQPFSSAGAQAGGNDPRDLWPAWYQLVKECRPPVVFGEQVESAIRHGWLDRLCDDLEREDYAVGAVGLPAACVGAFHVRHRLWFVADANDQPEQPRHAGCGREGMATPRHGGDGLVGGRAFGELADAESRRTRSAQQPGQLSRPECVSEVGSMADAEYAEWRPLKREDERNGDDAGRPQTHGQPRARREIRELGDSARRRLREHGSASRNTGHVDEPRHAVSAGLEGFAGDGDNGHEPGRHDARAERSAPAPGVSHFWSNADWIPCRDGKARPVEPGTFPLAHGVSARVGRLRGYGNAIVPEVAAAFIEAYERLEVW